MGQQRKTTGGRAMREMKESEATWVGEAMIEGHLGFLFRGTMKAKRIRTYEYYQVGPSDVTVRVREVVVAFNFVIQMKGATLPGPSAIGQSLISSAWVVLELPLVSAQMHCVLYQGRVSKVPTSSITVRMNGWMPLTPRTVLIKYRTGEAGATSEVSPAVGRRCWQGLARPGETRQERAGTGKSCKSWQVLAAPGQSCQGTCPTSRTQGLGSVLPCSLGRAGSHTPFVPTMLAGIKSCPIFNY